MRTLGNAVIAILCLAVAIGLIVLAIREVQTWP